MLKLLLGPVTDGSPKSAEDANVGFKSVAPISAPIATNSTEPYGKAFVEWIVGKNKSTADDGSAAELDDDDDDDLDIELVPIEQSYIMEVDAANWRTQDHYKLMGLQKFRHKATPKMISFSYKKQVLWHHPDRKSSANWSEKERSQADSYFTCVKKAYEILNDPTQRRLYDSVDNFEEAIPGVIKTEEKFYKEFGKAFARNERWFWPKIAPKLGDKATDQATVDGFYEFWYNAKSWREFGYFDEEVANETDSREQKRYVEKQNKNARKKKQVADKSRMIKLVDNAYASDPRIKAFRIAAKQAKLDAQQRKKDETAAKIKEEERIAAEAALVKEAAAKSASMDKKAIAEALKKAKKAFVKQCKRYDLYTDKWKIDDNTPAIQLTFTEDEVQDMKNTFPTETLKGFVAQPDVESFIAAVKVEVDKIEEQKEKEAALKAPWTQEEQELLEKALKEVPKDAADRWDQIAKCVPGRTVKACKIRIKDLMAVAKVIKEAPPVEWTEKEDAVVVKAASKVFPPGTQEIGGMNRWQQISNYLKIHAHTTWERSQKDIIGHVNSAKDVNKGLQKKKDNSDALLDFERTKGKGRDKSSLPEPENFKL